MEYYWIELLLGVALIGHVVYTTIINKKEG